MKTQKVNNLTPVALLQQVYSEHFVDGAVATDGVVYSAVVTCGTPSPYSAQVFDKLIDPGLAMRLQELYVSFTQQFTDVAAVTASMSYYWRIRSEGGALGSMGLPVATTMSWVNITGTYTKGVATTPALEDTFSGYISVGSVPRAPFRINLTAAGIAASTLTGKVKNSSYIEFAGIVIPGA